MNGSCSECSREGLIKRGLCTACYTRWWRGRSEEERRRPTMEERFWAKVDKGAPADCWPWLGANQPSGHGQFHISRAVGRVPASRFSLELALGERCPDGLHALHHCDNPPCVNPAHLYFGTPKDNAGDRVARGREPRHDQRPNAKLTAAKVVELRERAAAGEMLTDLAAEAGISSPLITRIVTGQEWRDVGGPRTSHKDQRGSTKRRRRKGEEQVAVGRSFLVGERTADQLHATGGGP